MQTDIRPIMKDAAAVDVGMRSLTVEFKVDDGKIRTKESVYGLLSLAPMHAVTGSIKRG